MHYFKRYATFYELCASNFRFVCLFASFLVVNPSYTIYMGKDKYESRSQILSMRFVKPLSESRVTLLNSYL